MRISVKIKTCLMTTVFSTVLAAVVLFSIVGNVERISWDNAQDDLQKMCSQVLSELVVDGKVVYAEDSVFVEDGTYSAVYGKNDRFLCGYVPDASIDNVPYTPGRLQYSGSWIVYDDIYQLKGYGEVYIRSVTDMRDVETVMQKSRFMAGVGTAAIAVLTALGTYLIMRRSLMPLSTIMTTASHISSGNNLSRRIRPGKANDEFRELGETFNSMFDRLEDSFDSERRFTNNAAHELRTPITVILAQSEFAAEPDCSEQDRLHALEKINAQASHMSALTNQLLTLARADRSAVKTQATVIDMSELMEMVAMTGEDLAAERNITLKSKIEPGIKVRGDESMLIRMALNLVENAVKYGREGGHIAVTLSMKNGYAVGCVTDDGIGIAPEHLESIWERFYQVDQAKSGAERGSGLGLSIVKSVAQAHGGDVTCASELGRGSSFKFKIPVIRKQRC